MPVPENESPNFDVEIKLIKDNFVPLGITDFKGRKENDCIQFKYKVIGSEVDRLSGRFLAKISHTKKLFYQKLLLAIKNQRKRK